MATITDLTAEELALIIEVLEASYQELREEIYKTEGTDFKRLLKAREQLLETVMGKLRPAAS